MTVLHKNLTGADLHEPKGADTAVSGRVYVSDGAGSGAWTAFASIPVGILAPYAGSTAPTNWLLCYGQNVSRVTYADLFAAISTTYGSGDGSTTFGLPDLRGRAVYGKDNMGGSTASRITAALSGITGTTLGSAGGAESFTIAQVNLPSYNLTVSGASCGLTVTTTLNISDVDRGAANVQNGSGSNAPSVFNAPISATSTIGGTLSIPSGGSGTAKGLVSPGIILNYIIYAGA